MNFDEAKQQVAESHEFQSFWHLEQRYPKAISRFYAEAAELYARHLANEKVREDRKFWVENDVAGSLCGRSDTELMKDRWKQIHTVPLPYPDEQ
jgi:hypothetical protein